MAINLNKDKVYRAAKPQDNDYSINDGGGLFLFVTKNGSKLWRFVYSFDDKRKQIAFGSYPNRTLESARRKTEEARGQIANGVDPSELRKKAKQAKKIVQLNDERINGGLPVVSSFADITRKWLDSTAHLTPTMTHKKQTSRIERLAFPVLGNIPI